MKLSTPLQLLVILAATLPMSQATAQNTGDAESENVLEEVVVTGIRDPVKHCKTAIRAADPRQGEKTG